MAMDKIFWRGLTRAQLDAAYNKSVAINAEKLASWQERSKRVHEAQGELLDQSYGPSVCFWE
jgi:hypothetical protein